MSMRTLPRVVGFLLLSSAPVPGPAWAQEPPEGDDAELAGEFGELVDEELDLLESDRVIESAARHRQEIGLSPSAITIFTREDIETFGGSSLIDLLRMVPGMDVIAGSPLHENVTARMFWTDENNHFLVLIDGREANFELLGVPLFSAEPISLDDIERIEVIRGPASALYGAGAFGGVISITTRAVPQATSLWSRLEGGEVGKLAFGARGNTVLGGFGVSLGGALDQRDTFDFRDVTGSRVWRLRGVVDRAFGEHRLRLDLGASSVQGRMITPVGMLFGMLNVITARAAYASEDLQAHLYWTWTPTQAELDMPLVYRGMTLAMVDDAQSDIHTLDVQVQYRLPEFYRPLLFLVGAGGRLGLLFSDQLIDAETFADINSPRYHQRGLSYLAGRAGAFIHGEYRPADWITVTAGVRLDWNSESADTLIGDSGRGLNLSPRLAAVFTPAAGHHLRIGLAQSFRKPSFLEAGLHVSATVPPGSPIDPDGFNEFMTRVLGNADLRSEKLFSAEAGYLGRFLSDRLSVEWNLYMNLYDNLIEMVPRLALDSTGLPDLSRSSAMSENTGKAPRIGGSELTVRYSLLRHVQLAAGWAHREVFLRDESGTYHSSDDSPKNLLFAGGRFRLPSGFLGSLYLFSRSKFSSQTSESSAPGNLLEAKERVYYPNQMLIIGKLGWRWLSGEGIEMEAGTKLFLPFSPWAGDLFHIREVAGGVQDNGKPWGGEELGRLLSFYVQGSF